MPNARSRVSAPEHFNSDRYEQPAVAVQLEVLQNQVEQPVHHHRKGQLILMLQGAATVQVPQGMWFVPPQHAVWIPGGIPHSSRPTNNAQIFFLFVDPGAVELPKTCCTLSITPLLRELIRHLAQVDPAYPPGGSTERLVMVLLEQLAGAPVQELHLPISNQPSIKRILSALTTDPADRKTLAQWANSLAMSERSLARLIVRETGLTFGRWRQQLHLILALGQLAEGEPVQRVAGNLGYDSVTAFITMFKKALGKSPTQYFAALGK
ncbi:MAG: AraC family transcriptional regulator [Alcaligenaceae bacterium]|nr:MAG: AraC family transcriptional regulator [Alcaligenaceae bacterium]